MAYSASAPLVPHRSGGAFLLADRTAAEVKESGTTIGTRSVADGIDGYPVIYSSVSGGQDLSVFTPGMLIEVTGSETANNTWVRVVEYRQATILAALRHALLIEGPGTSSYVTDAVGDSVTLRQAFAYRPSFIRSIQGMNHPLTVWASVATNLGTPNIQHSLDDGVTWVTTPGTTLPDTDNGDALSINLVMAFDALFRVTSVGASFAGRIWVA